MIDVHGHAVAADHSGTIPDAEQVGDFRILEVDVRLALADSRSGVFHDLDTLRDGRSCVAAGSVDGGRANDETHGQFVTSFLSLRGANLSTPPMFEWVELGIVPSLRESPHKP